LQPHLFGARRAQRVLDRVGLVVAAFHRETAPFSSGLPSAP
jgi:hypothetical protein